MTKSRKTTWHQEPSDVFDDAEFYEQGNIVTITGVVSLTIVCVGERHLVERPDSDLPITYRTATQFRSRFADGVLPGDVEDAWAWSNNGWFMFYDDEGNDLDWDPSYSLREAVAAASQITDTGEMFTPNAALLRRTIKAHGGLESFLAWCDNTTTDVFSTYDVLDEEWEAIKREFAPPLTPEQQATIVAELKQIAADTATNKGATK